MQDKNIKQNDLAPHIEAPITATSAQSLNQFSGMNFSYQQFFLYVVTFSLAAYYILKSFETLVVEHDIVDNSAVALANSNSALSLYNLTLAASDCLSIITEITLYTLAGPTLPLLALAYENINHNQRIALSTVPITMTGHILLSNLPRALASKPNDLDEIEAVKNLFEAIKNANLSEIVKLLENFSGDINAIDNGYTFGHIVFDNFKADYELVKVLKLLIKSGADFHIKSKDTSISETSWGRTYIIEVKGKTVFELIKEKLHKNHAQELEQFEKDQQAINGAKKLVDIATREKENSYNVVKKAIETDDYSSVQKESEFLTNNVKEAEELFLFSLIKSRKLTNQFINLFLSDPYHPHFINSIDEDGNTPLHILIEKKRIHEAENLLPKNPTINRKNSNDETPYHIAASKNEKSIIDIMVKHEKVKDSNLKTMNVLNKQKQSAFMVAIKSSNQDIAKEFITNEWGKELFDHPDLCAEQYELLSMSDLPDDEPEKANSGKIYLSDDGKYCVRDPKGIVQQGNLPNELYTAIKKEGLTTKLKDNNFKIDVLMITSNAGHTSTDTPVLAAVSKGYDEIAEPLLSMHNAKATVFNREHQSLLSLAVIHGKKNIVEQILKNDLTANYLNSEDNIGKTALIYAIEKNEIEILNLLLAKEGINKESVIELAYARRNQAALDVLVEHKADFRKEITYARLPNTPHTYVNYTGIDIGIYSLNHEILKKITQKNKGLSNWQNSYGLTPYEIASYLESGDIANMPSMTEEKHNALTLYCEGIPQQYLDLLKQMKDKTSLKKTKQLFEPSVFGQITEAVDNLETIAPKISDIVNNIHANTFGKAFLDFLYEHVFLVSMTAIFGGAVLRFLPNRLRNPNPTYQQPSDSKEDIGRSWSPTPGPQNNISTHSSPLSQSETNKKCILHLLDVFPKNIKEYKNSYILIGQKLQYIDVNGKPKAVIIGNFTQFSIKLTALNTANSQKIYLSELELNSLLSLNQDHILSSKK